mmetsp:Transcript_14106/g.42142  ORF Transcript_14106/g.42142 Transcript_14106/m.42142 type:complete len:326 (+) Transcript_14106:1341-2318(+)
MTSPLDAAQVRRAVAALLQHNGTGGGALDLGAQQFTLQLGLRRAPQDPSPKPRVVALPHALHSSEGRQRCLIVKDCDKPWLKALTVEGEAPGPKKPLPKRDGTRAAKMARRATPSRDARAGAGDLDKVVDKVLALSKLRTSYKQFAARRELRDRFDAFYADERVLPMLGKLLGSTFFGRKRQPVAVRVTRGPEALAAQIQAADAGARLVLKPGTCVALVVATTDHSIDEVTANVVAACDAVVRDHVPRKWKNVLSVVVKLPDSAALPVWNAALEAPPPAPKRAAQSEEAPSAKKKKKVAPPAAPARSMPAAGKSLKARMKKAKGS